MDTAIMYNQARAVVVTRTYVALLEFLSVRIANVFISRRSWQSVSLL
jgi:hypothetical protein